MMNKKHCAGCHNNFYNGHNPMGVTSCWSLDTAMLIWRVRVGNWETRDQYRSRKAIRKPSCYFSGPGGDHFIDPKNAK